MYFLGFLALTALLRLALAASNQFSNPPPKGSGVSAATWTQGSTYTLSWSTDWTDVALYIQSSGSNSDGSPLQSYTLYESDGTMPTSPYSFLVGDNLDLSLSPFHFEIYSPSQKKGFVSDNVNFIARSSNSASSSSSSWDTQTQLTTVTFSTTLAAEESTATVTVTAGPAPITGGGPATITGGGVGATITTATPTTVVDTSGSTTVAAPTRNAAAGVVRSAGFGIAAGLGCILGTQLLG